MLFQTLKKSTRFISLSSSLSSKCVINRTQIQLQKPTQSLFLRSISTSDNNIPTNNNNNDNDNTTTTSTTSKVVKQAPIFDWDTGIKMKGPTYKNPNTWPSLKSRFKRAKRILDQLNTEGMIECENARPIPFFKVGDAIEVSYKQSTNTKRTIMIRGMVIARRNKGLGSGFKVIGMAGKEAFELNFPLYSPLIQEIKVIQRAFLHRGYKKVKRAKLYYAYNKSKSLFEVKDGFAYEMERRQERLREKLKTLSNEEIPVEAKSINMEEVEIDEKPNEK